MELKNQVISMRKFKRKDLRNSKLGELKQVHFLNSYSEAAIAYDTYNNADYFIVKFFKSLIVQGKKSKAEKIFCNLLILFNRFFLLLQLKNKLPSDLEIDVFHFIYSTFRYYFPVMELRPYVKRGKGRPVPYLATFTKRIKTVIKWLILSVRSYRLTGRSYGVRIKSRGKAIPFYKKKSSLLYKQRKIRFYRSPIHIKYFLEILNAFFKKGFLVSKKRLLYKKIVKNKKNFRLGLKRRRITKQMKKKFFNFLSDLLNENSNKKVNFEFLNVVKEESKVYKKRKNAFKKRKKTFYMRKKKAFFYGKRTSSLYFNAFKNLNNSYTQLKVFNTDSTHLYFQTYLNFFKFWNFAFINKKGFTSNYSYAYLYKKYQSKFANIKKPLNFKVYKTFTKNKKNVDKQKQKIFINQKKNFSTFVKHKKNNFSSRSKFK